MLYSILARITIFFINLYFNLWEYYTIEVLFYIINDIFKYFNFI